MTTKSKRVRPADAPLRAVAYSRVSTGDQVDSGAGLEAQEAAMKAAAEQRGWVIVARPVDAGISGKAMGNRPGLATALHMVRSGEADVILVSKLDRLSRSLVDFASLMAEADRRGWGICALDLGVDTTSPAGRLVASVMSAVSEWEASVISSRTKDALAARRASGVTLGRPRDLPAEVVARIRAERAAGATLVSIAEGLTRDGVPTARGGSVWGYSTIRYVLGYAEPAA